MNEFAEIMKRLDRIEEKLNHIVQMPSKEQYSVKKQLITQKKVGLSGGIQHLIESGFFEQPKGIGEIHKTLKTNGWFCNLTSLPSYLLPLIKPPRGPLNRFTEDSKYKYVVRK